MLEFLDFSHSGGLPLRFLVFDGRFTTYACLQRLNAAGIRFVTVRRRGHNLVRAAQAAPPQQRHKVRVPEELRVRGTLLMFQLYGGICDSSSCGPLGRGCYRSRVTDVWWEYPQSWRPSASKISMNMQGAGRASRVERWSFGILISGKPGDVDVLIVDRLEPIKAEGTNHRRPVCDCSAER